MNSRTTLRQMMLFLALPVALSPLALAQRVAVRYPQGSVHGFLTVHSEDGANIGYGESIQSVSGDRTTMRTTLHFRDGSLDDETAVYTQHRVIAFVSDHHIQRGPFFKTAIDEKVDANGQVSITTTGEDGKVKQESSHIDLPPDLSNGIVAPILYNIPHGSAGISVGMVLPVGKGRVIRLHITPDSTASFTAVEGATRTANIYRIKLDLGGIVGVVAPMIGKQPADVMLWVLEGPAPVVVREDAQLSEGGPIISIRLAGTSYPSH